MVVTSFSSPPSTMFVSYTLLNIYTPNKRQIAFLTKTIRKAKKLQQGHLLLCGDFNIIPDFQLDSSTNTRCYTFHLHDLHDAWRCYHANERDYTFFSPSHNSYSGIDRFLLYKWLLQNVQSSEIHAITWSDHAPINMILSNSPSQPNSYTW